MSRRHPAGEAIREAFTEQPTLSHFSTYQQEDLVAQYGADRMVRMPIAENAMLGMALGMALVGRRVLFSVNRVAFLFSAFDQLVNQVATWRYMSDGQFSVPLVIRGLTRGGEHLGAQHEHVPYGLLSQIPGLVVAVPGSPNAVGGLLRTALGHPDPVVVLESPRLFAPTWAELPEPEPSAAALPFGVAGLARPGTDLTLVAIGNTVIESLLAARRLAEHGIQARVVDLRTAAPLDRDGVAAMVVPDRPVILVDEQSRSGSVLTDLAYHLVRTGAVRPEHVELLTGAPVPAPVSAALLDGLLPDAERIVRAVIDTPAPLTQRR
ncbi:pyruvate dehydrogenase E1 component beta subunit [Micromonospora phaseoli]|uniref:Pyruvate dehydrogenase E1 component beta subunit n=1 Tax=Micromonospora phaseoli TaxID=1144548 RepID=A0A1H7CN57_9ACTN|nr:transketolase C-terminal domain-containing protein [Micromonospora phaseoli]PZV91659.1 pyruvate dehydrogenase E1 component beta subunit [Micromonospora phaseoli]GIJ79290.1 pyruvate dehydrogenase subunit beta [Micromonospora phaseoli]SEJ91193.1 pyruvate dehydrogenase E1 component beta subunit [Micromonospora phaseoli]